MKLLLDTCVFIWLASHPRRMPQTAQALFAQAAGGAWLSAISVWEIAIKHKTGKLRLPAGMPPIPYVHEVCRRHRIALLPLSPDSAALLDKMPDIHRDPFDRMLICEAIANQMTILTPDPLIAQYPVLTRW